MSAPDVGAPVYRQGASPRPSDFRRHLAQSRCHGDFRVTRQIAPEHFQAFRRLLEESCGILLGDNKQYLVTSRLGSLMAREGLADLGALVQRMQRPVESSLRGQVIEAMTTNETSWFRDIYPFANLQQRIFPELAAAGQRRIRIWSAACSSGQEPYSVSIALQELKARGVALDADILATDLSPSMVATTKSGIYNESAIRRGLSPERLQRYFEKVANGWQVRPEVRGRVRAQTHNLLESFSGLGRFELILCRNVLIYFSPQTREDILRRMCRQLNPGGYLIVGASESLSRHMDDLEMIRGENGVMYRRRHTVPV